MPDHDALVAELCARAGVATQFIDVYGNTVETPVATRRAVLAAFGFPAGSGAEARESLDRLAQLELRRTPRLAVVESGRPQTIPVRAGLATLRYVLTDERGQVREGRGPVREGKDGPLLDLPRLDAGYYRLAVEGEQAAAATVIAAPPRCWLPPELADDARAFGVAAQLYALPSERNFGIGTYRDAGALAERAAALGAAFVGLSPVHALFTADRSKVSPYSPSSRLFLETLHIDPAVIPGIAGSAAWQAIAAARPEIERLRALSLVDHAAVARVLSPILEAAFAARPWRRDPDFAAFRRRGGEALEAHATFEALSERFTAEGRIWVGEWPEGYRRFGSAEVARFRSEAAERIAFHVFLQWLADSQLDEAGRLARASGMAVGLYRDLAVGADRAGSEVWHAPERFGLGLSVGAPPDLLGPQGQDWGLPPLDPLGLQADGLSAFRALLAANMRHAGAMRMDHAFQLRRLFVMPLGGRPADGTFIDYPFEALLAALRVESQRARCMVVGEDLGTAPPGFSEAIMRAGVLSYRVLVFEQEGGGFKPPAAYPREAMAVTSTHDLPTFVGWWHGFDTDLREALGIYPRERAAAERQVRALEKGELLAAFAKEGLDVEPSSEPPYESMLRFLARTPSLLQAVQLEDIAGERNQANVPGTVNEHPNWRRKLGVDLDALTRPGGPLARTAAVLASEGRGGRPLGGALAGPPPRATYRLQFHAGFTFEDAAAVVPYLARLGISHLYASPIQTARPGSMHGYDIVDHGAVNPELGGEDGLDRLVKALKAHGMGLVLDIVPNHMAVGGADNPWWLSLLEWGELSPWAHAFDVDWQRLGAEGRIILPFLGDRYGDALERGDLELRFAPEDGAFSVHHYEHRFPVTPLTYPLVLDRALAALDGEREAPAAVRLLTASERLRTMALEQAAERRAAHPHECEPIKAEIAAALAEHAPLREAMARALALVNGTPGHAESFGTLHRILEGQSYRLAHWRVAASDINYRRFFDINSLAGLRVEDEDIFARTHALIFRLVREGKVQGLRIDHVDGLADPAGYLTALQREVGPGFYVVVEKILEPGERLRPWPIAGTTGYDALAALDGLFVDPRGKPSFDVLDRRLSGAAPPKTHAVKAEILETSFASELEVLVSDLKRIAQPDRRTRDFTALALRKAVVEIIARFPVYRCYIVDGPLSPSDRALVEGAVAKAKRWSALPDRSVHDFVADVLLGAIETDAPGRPDGELARRFRRRFQQLSGPVMAKALEDTLFYRYVRLIALNEVGGDPHRFGMEPDAFNAFFRERARDWPHSMLASATHDTKRGEDARGRLIPLAEMPEALSGAVGQFEALSERFVQSLEDGEAPDASERYFLLQTLFASWPNELLHDLKAKDEAIAAWRERLEDYARKALREAKRHTSWVSINEPYEAAVLGFVEGVTRPDMLAEFAGLARRIAHLGRLNGLARTVLKCTLPGVPDFYQGTEFWDLSLVDPDNRRPVDFDARAAALEAEADWPALLAAAPDGRLKQRVIARLLADRAALPQFYAGADYAPLAAAGTHAGELFAFTRASGEDALLVVVPRLFAARIEEETNPVGRGFWEDTSVPAAPRAWRDVLTGRDFSTERGALDVGALFNDLPFAVLRAQ